MGLVDLIEAVALDQLDNPAETGFHVGGQDIELSSNPVFQQFYDPRHLRILLHFCNRLPPDRSRDTHMPPRKSSAGGYPTPLHWTTI